MLTRTDQTRCDARQRYQMGIRDRGASVPRSACWPLRENAAQSDKETSVESVGAGSGPTAEHRECNGRETWGDSHATVDRQRPARGATVTLPSVEEYARCA